MLRPRFHPVPVFTHAHLMQALGEAGSVPVRELHFADVQVESAQQQLENMAQRLGLRAAFLRGELTATQVELKGMCLATATNREAALRHLAMISADHQRLASLAEVGSASTIEVQAVQSEMEATQAQVKLADLELIILDQKLADATTN